MLKKFLLAIFAIFAVNGYAQTELKFGHLNTQSLMQAMPETKEVLKRLEDLSKKYEAELTSLNDDFQKKFTDFKNQQDSLPPAIKQRRAQELTEMQERINSFRQTAMKSVQETQEKLMMPIREKVMKSIKEVSDEMGLIYVFNTASLLHVSDKSIDLEPILKKRFNIK